MAGMLAAILTMHRKTAPPNAQLKTLNENVKHAVADSNIVFPVVPTPLSESIAGDSKQWYAAISSLGYSGTIAHTLIGLPPVAQRKSLERLQAERNDRTVEPSTRYSIGTVQHRMVQETQREPYAGRTVYSNRMHSAVLRTWGPSTGTGTAATAAAAAAAADGTFSLNAAVGLEFMWACSRASIKAVLGASKFDAMQSLCLKNWQLVDESRINDVLADSAKDITKLDCVVEDDGSVYICTNGVEERTVHVEASAFIAPSEPDWSAISAQFPEQSTASLAAVVPVSDCQLLAVHQLPIFDIQYCEETCKFAFNLGHSYWQRQTGEFVTHPSMMKAVERGVAMVLGGSVDTVEKTIITAVAAAWVRPVVINSLSVEIDRLECQVTLRTDGKVDCLVSKAADEHGTGMEEVVLYLAGVQAVLNDGADAVSNVRFLDAEWVQTTPPERASVATTLPPVSSCLCIGGEDFCASLSLGALVEAGVLASSGSEMAVIRSDLISSADTKKFDLIVANVADLLKADSELQVDAPRLFLEALGSTILPRITETGTLIIISCSRSSTATSTDADVFRSLSIDQALTGALMVTKVEHPQLRVKAVSFGPSSVDNVLTSEDLARAVFATAADASREIEIMISSNGPDRSVRRFQDISKKFEGRVDDRCRSDGAYIITGGLGGLGLQTAKLLVRLGAKHLFLVSRSGKVPYEGQGLEEDLAWLQSAESGADVHIVRCDVSDESSVVSTLSTARSAVEGGIAGVVHCAGVVKEGKVASAATASSSSIVWQSKALSAWWLHKHTLEDDLVSFVSLSSISAAVGNVGLAAYSMANRFLDGLTKHRRGMGLHGVSVRLPAVSEVGMAAVNMGDQLQKGGAAQWSISPAGYEFIMRRALLAAPSTLPGSGVLTIMPSAMLDWLDGSLVDQFSSIPRGRKAAVQYQHQQLSSSQSQRQQQQQKKKGAKLFGPGGSTATAAAAATTAIPLAFIPDIVRKQVADLAANFSEQVGDDDNLLDMGLDSLSSSDLVHRLSRELNLTLPITLLFDNPTTTDIIRTVTDLVSEQAVPLPTVVGELDAGAVVSGNDQGGGLDDTVDASRLELQTRVTQMERVIDPSCPVFVSYFPDSGAPLFRAIVFPALGQPTLKWHQFACLLRSRNIEVHVVSLPGTYYHPHVMSKTEAPQTNSALYILISICPLLTCFPPPPCF